MTTFGVSCFPQPTTEPWTWLTRHGGSIDQTSTIAANAITRIKTATWNHLRNVAANLPALILMARSESQVPVSATNDCAPHTVNARIEACNRRRWRMRVVALEEHFTVPTLVRRIDPEAISAVASGRARRRQRRQPWSCCRRSASSGCKLMDDAGITVQVLSGTGPGPDLVPGADGVAIAREMNDHLAEAVARASRPLRGLRGPADAEPRRVPPQELARAVKDLHFVGALVNGTTEGRFLDHPSYRRPAGGGRRTRRSDLHPSAPAARARAPGLLLRPAAGRGAACWKPPAGGGIRKPPSRCCAS